MRAPTLAFAVLLLLGCGGAAQEQASSSSETSGGDERSADAATPVRVATTRVGLAPIPGLDIPGEGAPGFASADRQLMLMITEFPQPYGPATIDEALSWPEVLQSAPRQTLTRPDGGAATWVCAPDGDELACALVLGDAQGSATIVVVARGPARERMLAAERALRGAVWLEPYAPPRRFLADLALLCELASGLSAPSEGTWLTALMLGAADAIVDPQLVELLRVFPSVVPDDRMRGLVDLAAAYDAPGYECVPLQHALTH